MGGGVFQDRTLFKGTFELFMFEATGSEIRFNLPETKEKVTSDCTIERVDSPQPFDLKLKIPGDPRGPKSTSACAPRPPIAKASRSTGCSARTSRSSSREHDCARYFRKLAHVLDGADGSMDGEVQDLRARLIASHLERSPKRQNRRAIARSTALHRTP